MKADKVIPGAMSYAPLRSPQGKIMGYRLYSYEANAEPFRENDRVYYLSNAH